jgi:hypothetical protein
MKVLRCGAIAYAFALSTFPATANACPPGYDELKVQFLTYCVKSVAPEKPNVPPATTGLPWRSGHPFIARSPPVSPAPAVRLTPVRSYLKSDQIPPPSIGAYGIVAFRARPTTASRQRLLMTCASFVSYLPRQDTIPASVPLSDYMLTVWPLDNPDASEAKKDDCNYVIDHYDLYAADSAIADAEQQGAHFGAAGPFLVGWSPSNTRGVKDKVVLVVDMSSFDSQDSFDHAFRFWKEKIIQDPTLWRHGFSIEGMRLAVRDFVDHYGSSIISAVNVWKN